MTDHDPASARVTQRPRQDRVRRALWIAGPLAGGAAVTSVGVAVGQPGAGAVAGTLTTALVSLVRVLL